MKILITGGAGCLGSNLVERYFKQGCEICVIDNFATGKREVLAENPRLRIFDGTIADSNLIRTIFADFKPTHVIHSAASYKDPFNWVEDIQTNVLGSVNLANAALDFGVTRFINFQTALCYGRPNKLPIPVDHPTTPFTSYGISKTAGEAYLINSDLPVVSLRLANICGPRLAIGPIPNFYKRLKAGQRCYCSESVRDFLDIGDFFCLMDIVLANSAPIGVFNVSSGKGHSILDVFHTVADYLGIKAPEVPTVPIGADDVSHVILDPTLTTETFDWQSQVNFKQTIYSQLKWYDQYGVNDIHSHLANPVPVKQ